MTNTHSLTLETKPGSVLSLLVENQGRVNFGPYLHDYKVFFVVIKIISVSFYFGFLLIISNVLQGILGTVEFNGKTLDGRWSITGYPLEKMDGIPNTDVQNSNYGPVLYEGELILPEGQQPLDTFLDTGGWGKVLFSYIRIPYEGCIPY